MPINQLSGGQRKRVSIAVELVTKPSVIYLDEPTSGLDPATEEKIMKLFRQIAESGRTVILTTHAMENVKLFDKIVLLMRGKLVFYGKPDEALKHVGATSFKELYDKIEDPIEQRLQKSNGANRHQVTEQVAEEWKQKFTQTPQYKKNVYEPLKDIGKLQSGRRSEKTPARTFRLDPPISDAFAPLLGSAYPRQDESFYLVHPGADCRRFDVSRDGRKSAARFCVILCYRSSRSGSEHRFRRAKSSANVPSITANEWSISD